MIFNCAHLSQSLNILNIKNKKNKQTNKQNDKVETRKTNV
jgi:hypothetical protein